MRVIYLTSVWLHVLAAMTWVGGMVAFVAAVMPYFRRRPDAERAAFLDWFGPRFRLITWTCFAIFAITGTFNLWARGVRPGDFLRPEWRATPFGSMLLMKLAAVSIAVAISVVHERTASRASARWVGRSLLAAALVITIAAVALVRAM